MTQKCHCPDAALLRFFCETIHPVVQPEEQVVASLLKIYNSELRKDGFMIAEAAQVSGRPVYAARDTAIIAPAVEAAKALGESLDRDYISRQITRMESAIHSEPDLAIGTAKEFIETCCKTILRERGQTVDEAWEIPKLVKATLDVLDFTPSMPRSDEVTTSIRKVVGSLTQVAQSVAELRNRYGTGHGKDATTAAPPTHHARLAVSAASTIAVFLFEAHLTTGSS